jgi:hypothetical protein
MRLPYETYLPNNSTINAKKQIRLACSSIH